MIRVVVDEACQYETRHNQENHTESIIFLVVRVLVLVSNQIDRRVGRRQEHHLQDGVVYLRGGRGDASQAAVSLYMRLHASNHAARIASVARGAYRGVLPEARPLRKFDEPHCDQVQVCTSGSGSGSRR